MRIVTFLGNATYIDKVVEKNKLTDIYVDVDYVYVFDEKGNMVSSSFDKTFNGKVVVHYVSSGIPMKVRRDDIVYANVDVEAINRRIRIAKMLSLIANEISDDILFLDSDVTVESIDSFIEYAKSYSSQGLVSLCLPAIMKPFSYVDVFCKSTNFFISSRDRVRLIDALSTYISQAKYVHSPVDLYIHSVISSIPIRWRGVCHHKPFGVYCI